MKNFLRYTFTPRVIAYLLVITFVAAFWVCMFICAIIIGNWISWCDYRQIHIGKKD